MASEAVVRMSEARERHGASDWVSASFDAQRRFLEGAHRLARGNVDVQRRFVRAFGNSLDAQRATQREAMALAEGVLRGSLVAARTSMPGREADTAGFEDAIEEGLASVDELQAEWGSATSRALADGVELNDELLSMYADLLDASFEAALEANEGVAEGAERFARSPRQAVDVEVEGEDA